MMTIIRPTFSRRTLLAGIGGVTLLSTCPSFASETDTSGAKLIIVILRGAMDGLGAIPLPDNPQLRQIRPDLIAGGTLPLSGDFALHPSLQNLHTFFLDGQASVLHAASGPYRERSHFLAQDLLESGVGVNVTLDGWLSRAIQRAPTKLTAVSIGPVTPLILRGSTTANTWSPPALPEVDEDTIARVHDLYAEDALLGPAFIKAIELDNIAGAMMTIQRRGGADSVFLSGAGQLLAADGGPDIAVVSLPGWDTHANQPAALSRRLTQLDKGLSTLKTSLGPAWKKTAIAVVTEFGRTVAQNGSRGSDHGTGGAAFVLGGAVKGGQILGDWPGLKPDNLYENRDLFPANDLRGLFKSLLKSQFGLSQQDLSFLVFPESVGVRDISTT